MGLASVFGSFRGPNGAPATGTVRFKPTAVHVEGDKVIARRAVDLPLADGRLWGRLYATHGNVGSTYNEAYGETYHGALVDLGFRYEVTELIDGAAPKRYVTSLPTVGLDLTRP